MEGRAAHVSSDAFFQALPVLWEYLGPRMQTKKDIRATCSGARLQHDRLLSHLHITLGRSPGMGKKRTKEIPPPPFFLWKVLQVRRREGTGQREELGAMLHAVVGRGAPLQTVAVCFAQTANRRRTEAEL